MVSTKHSSDRNKRRERKKRREEKGRERREEKKRKKEKKNERGTFDNRLVHEVPRLIGNQDVIRQSSWQVVKGKHPDEITGQHGLAGIPRDEFDLVEFPR